MNIGQQSITAPSSPGLNTWVNEIEGTLSSLTQTLDNLCHNVGVEPIFGPQPPSSAGQLREVESPKPVDRLAAINRGLQTAHEAIIRISTLIAS